MLDLRLLRFFIAIYEEKNITAAAARCHVSQPSLSAGLRQLEEALGDSLFIRGKKGVEAKDPAHYLYPHAVKLVEEARRLPTLFRQKATRARLNIAIMPDLSRRRVAGLHGHRAHLRLLLAHGARTHPGWSAHWRLSIGSRSCTTVVHLSGQELREGLAFG